MPRIAVNGVELFHEVTGGGAPLVLVHGSWSDHDSWAMVLPALAAASACSSTTGVATA